jgi:hypothetical protein
MYTNCCSSGYQLFVDGSHVSTSLCEPCQLAEIKQLVFVDSVRINATVQICTTVQCPEHVSKSKLICQMNKKMQKQEKKKNQLVIFLLTEKIYEIQIFICAISKECWCKIKPTSSLKNILSFNL